MYVCINPKMSPIRDPVRGRKNAPIDCWRYTQIFQSLYNFISTLDFPLRILVQSDMVGAIIGRGGQTIRQITQQTR